MDRDPQSFCGIRGETRYSGLRRTPGGDSSGPVHRSRGLSSVGRALSLHGRCQGFDSPRLHSPRAPLTCGNAGQGGAFRFPDVSAPWQPCRPRPDLPGVPRPASRAIRYSCCRPRCRTLAAELPLPGSCCRTHAVDGAWPGVETGIHVHKDSYADVSPAHSITGEYILIASGDEERGILQPVADFAISEEDAFGPDFSICLICMRSRDRNRGGSSRSGDQREAGPGCGCGFRCRPSGVSWGNTKGPAVGGALVTMNIGHPKGANPPGKCPMMLSEGQSRACVQHWICNRTWCLVMPYPEGFWGPTRPKPYAYGFLDAQTTP